jgi:hypothetical protein
MMRFVLQYFTRYCREMSASLQLVPCLEPKQRLERLSNYEGYWEIYDRALHHARDQTWWSTLGMAFSSSSTRSFGDIVVVWDQFVESEVVDVAALLVSMTLFDWS